MAGTLLIKKICNEAFFHITQKQSTPYQQFAALAHEISRKLMAFAISTNLQSGKFGKLSTRQNFNFTHSHSAINYSHHQNQ
ncbi:hypothetical protein [Burkholderia pyrrocinia]|uniref:hypothetical protein n=1 Tax=Burkholderia pyrrocinia TaxID=60550 RepID=UPI0030CE093F